jgi:N-acetyltransferase 10
VTSPSPENLQTLFQFILVGFDQLEYKEHTDYELVQSTNPGLKDVIVRINIFRSHRQVGLQCLLFIVCLFSDLFLF